MIIVQHSVRCRSGLSGMADHTNTIAASELRCDCSVGSAAEAELSELLRAAKGDPAATAGVLRQAEIPAREPASRIAVKAKGKIFFMEIADIIAVHAEGNYASLKYRSGTYLLRESLCSIAAKLKPHGFVQIHRSVLVNASIVDEVWPLSTGEYRLRVRNGNEYVVTRRYKDNLKELAEVWLGSERFGGSMQVVAQAARPNRRALPRAVVRSASN